MRYLLIVILFCLSACEPVYAASVVSSGTFQTYTGVHKSDVRVVTKANPITVTTIGTTSTVGLASVPFSNISTAERGKYLPSGTLVTGSGGTGTATTFTPGSIVFAGASGVYSQDNANFNYNPTGVFGGSALDLGTQGANPDDAVFEVYATTAGNATAHFHNNGVQGASGGGKVSLNSTPTATPAAMASGSRLGILESGGTYDNTLALKNSSDISFFATQTWTSTHTGSKMMFNTVPNNSTTKTLALTLDQDQTATFVSTVAGTSFNSITALASSTSPMDGSAAVGTSTTVARQDHVHPTDTSRAALAGSSSQAFAASSLTTTSDIDSSGDFIVYSHNGSTPGNVRAGVQMIGSGLEVRTYINGATKTSVTSTGLSITGTITVSSGGSTNKAICWKSGTTLGYCSTIVAVDGSCTCN